MEKVRCMKIGICENDRPVAADIAERVRTYFSLRGYDCEIGIWETAASFPTEEESFDIVLLDCRLPDGNGLDIAGELQKQKNKPIVIFISAYEEYVYQSFRVGTFRYLIKPIEQDALCEALDSFLTWYEHNMVIEIPTAEGILFARLNDVIYFESTQKHSIVRLRQTEYLSETSYEASRSLAEYTALIENPAFFRTHKRYYVNMRYIVSIDKNVAMLSNGERVEISRRRAVRAEKSGEKPVLSLICAAFP